MKTGKVYNRIKIGSFLSGILIFLSVSASAQLDVAVTKALAKQTSENKNHWQIVVGLDTGISLPKSLSDFENPQKNPIKDPNNYSLLDVETGHKIQIIYVYLETSSYYTSGALNGSGLPGEFTLYLDPTERLDPQRHYHLYVFNILFGDQPAKTPPQKNVTFPDVSISPNGEKVDDVKDSLSFTAADGREDSNIYLSGEIVTAAHSKPDFSGDVKIDMPVKRIIGDRVHNFDPFFELKVGHGPDVDPDSMKFGVNWEFPAARYRGTNVHFPIRRVLFKNAPQIEANTNWTNINFVVDTRFRFMSRTFTNKYATFYFRPFIGQEFGKNLKSPVTEAENDLIYRPLLGSTMNLIFLIQKAGIRDISIEGDYIRRWLLKREISFDKADDGGIQPLRVGKGPRDYLTAKFNLDFTKSFGATLTFENGRLPPSFKTVDRKFSIGLTYRVKLD